MRIRFDERREIFQFAVAVRVAFVSRLVRNANVEKTNTAATERSRPDAALPIGCERAVRGVGVGGGGGVGGVGEDSRKRFHGKGERAEPMLNQGVALRFLDGG